MRLKGNTITWLQPKSAYQWDQSSFTLPLHEKLTSQHFELDSAGKMRNHLAEDVLDRKMHFLMQVTQCGAVITETMQENNTIYLLDH